MRSCDYARPTTMCLTVRANDFCPRCLITERTPSSSGVAIRSRKLRGQPDKAYSIAIVPRPPRSQSEHRARVFRGHGKRRLSAVSAAESSDGTGVLTCCDTAGDDSVSNHSVRSARGKRSRRNAISSSSNTITGTSP